MSEDLKGTVFLSFAPERGVSGYWDLEPDGPPSALEQLPSGTSVWGAVEWGRARAPRIALRFDDPWGGGVYWFIGDWPGEQPEVEFLDPYPERDEAGNYRAGKRPRDEQHPIVRIFPTRGA
jgi:hypothetical protein